LYTRYGGHSTQGIRSQRSATTVRGAVEEEILTGTGVFDVGQEPRIEPNHQKHVAVTEALIRQRVEDYAKAIRARDIDRVRSLYTPDIVSFDLNPPLR